MRWIVFPNDDKDLRFCLRINADLADNVVILNRKVRIYFEGGFEEYEISKREIRDTRRTVSDVNRSIQR